MTPGSIGICHAELRRFIVVYGNCYHVGSICRCGEIARQRFCRIIGNSRYNQQTVCIVAASCTNSIYKCLVEFHCLAVAIEGNFVHSFKDQVIVIVCKVIGNLCPECLEFFQCSGIGALDPVFIVVCIYNGIHTIVHTVIDNFLDSGKESSIYLIV